MQLPLAGSVAAELPRPKYAQPKRTARGAEGHAGLHRRHGQGGTALHVIWVHMRQRCLDPKHNSYADYGGRGITIDSAWSDFVIFATDVGPRPSAFHSLDRIDNDGPYAAWNCRWATRQEQLNNKRNNHLVNYQGKCYTLAEASRVFGIAYNSVYARKSRMVCCACFIYANTQL